MQKADPLLRTKLRLPFVRPGLVARPRLQEQLARGLCSPLTLVTAPAGFGKTTLVASCVVASGMPVAWLSLDKNDNDAGRFVSYLIAAFQEADPTLGGAAAGLRAAAWQASDQAILASLINDLAGAAGHMALVLDDYQFITSQAVHKDVSFLVEHCPGTLHVVIASRSDPPLPLARLRARGQLAELRAADLRFTEPEAAQFLNDVMDLRLDAEAVAVLEQRTEGWIAGLQLASIALQSHRSARDREDAREFIEGFSGTSRFILDYLLEEVLAGQPPEIQRFLLCTSLLERLNPALCDAVVSPPGAQGLAGAGAGPRAGSDALSRWSSAAVLEYLEHANLFLVPLDDKRFWYRYHHLFADLLQARLRQTFTGQDVAALHTRAGRWYEQNGFAYDAIHHASLTGDNEWVEHLIEQNYVEMFSRGETAAIRFLTGELSRGLVHSRPWLCIYEAESHAWFGELDEADALLAVAEQHIRSGVASADTQHMLGHLSYVKSRVTAMRGDIRRAIELSLAARESTPAGNQALLGKISAIMGYAYFLDGRFDDAIRALNATIRSDKNAGVINTTAAAYCVLARIYAIQGQLRKSLETYREAESFIHAAGGRHLGATAIVLAGIADVFYAWNDLEAALSHIQQGLELVPNWNKPDDIALAYSTCARILQAQGNAAEAAEATSKGSRVIQSRGVFPEARDAVEAAEISLLLAEENSLAASRRTASLEERLSSRDSLRFVDELAHITLARACLAQKRPDEAAGLLSHLEASAQSGGRLGRLIEIMVLKALALQKSGDPARALATVAHSLGLAVPEGYVRVFLDEGRPMQELLARWLAQAGASPLRDYAMRLLAQFDARPPSTMTAQETARAPGYPVEPLSPRELEVLSLIAIGRTNQEIARQLVVAPGTVKAHTASIYRKLDAANRTEAVARARQFGILA